ncbi:MAG: arsenosugar biosynthesis radical SAM protein ArsS [Bdellovibrionota bacterium]
MNLSDAEQKFTSFRACLATNNILLERAPLEILQINVGKLCNQACTHCHVDAGPTKTRENLTEATAEKLIELAATCPTLTTVDLTGGAPEMNPHFRHLVMEFRRLGLQVMDRCNLTVLSLDGQEDTAEFLANNQVTVVASLPCYTIENVDKQRGNGVFEASIKGLRLLNEFGYGREGSGLTLDLVYNPIGANLPPQQDKLEADYKKMLLEHFGIYFSNLYCITNMPIKRFKAFLRRQGKEVEYMRLLQDNFNTDAVKNVMCRNLISVGWDGQIFDCDFNQMLGMPVGGQKRNIHELSSLNVFNSGDIALGDHCYGCTAGAGSSCSGTLL